jgi:type I restriction enzyme, S subunit
MHDGWTVLRLGDAVEIKHGFAFSGSEFSADPGYPTVVTPGNFRIGGGFQQTKVKTFSGDVPDGFVLEPGDLIVTMTDLSKTGDTLGYPALVPGDRTYLHNQRIGKVLLRDRRLVDLRYLAFVMQTSSYRAYVLGSASGSTVRHTSPSRILDYRAPFPPLQEQQRIAGVLGALDDLIDTNRRIVDAIARLSRVAFARCSRTARHEVALRSVAVVNEHKTSVGAGAVQYLDIASLGDGVIEWPEPIDWSVAPTRARRLAKVGDTLWSTVRPNRRAHALLVDAPDNLVVSTGVAVLTPTAIGPAYLYAATDDQTFVDQLVSRADGSAYPAVRADAFETSAIPLPSADQLRRFEVAMWPLWLAVAELQYEARTAARDRDELLPLLLSGRLHVEDVAA